MASNSSSSSPVATFDLGDFMELSPQSDTVIKVDDPWSGDDFDNETLELLDMVEVNASTVQDEGLREMVAALEKDQPSLVPTVDQKSEETKQAKRFKTVTEEQMQMIEDQRQSLSTKRNTKWGVKLFQGTVYNSKAAEPSSHMNIHTSKIAITSINILAKIKHHKSNPFSVYDIINDEEGNANVLKVL